MKCPLFGLLKRVEINSIEPMFGDCLKEECEWWSPSIEMCAVLDILKTLFAIDNDLGKIAKELMLLRPGR